MRWLILILMLVVGVLLPLRGVTLQEEISRQAPQGGVVRLESPCTISGRVVVPENVTLLLVGNAGIEIAHQAELRIDGRIEAGATTIFSGPGKVTGRLQAMAVLPQWFGAKGDESQDDAPAINRAAELARTSMARRLLIPAGRYRIASSIELRCNVDCFGVLVKNIELDETKTTVGGFTRTPVYQPKQPVLIRVSPDESPILLDSKAFYGIQRGGTRLPVFAGIGRAGGKGGNIDLQPGGTLYLHSTDFASSRNNQRGDEYYAKFDCFMVVSARGDVMPEAFYDYRLPETASEWRPGQLYRRGDYCRVGDRLFKATYPTGPGAFYQDKFLGKAEIGPVDPARSVRKKYRYKNGQEDTLTAWAGLRMSCYYVPPQEPLTINGLAVEVRSDDPQQRVKPISDRTMAVTRSGVTINRLRIVSTDRNALLSTLLGLDRCAGLTLNDCFFSGATFHGLGYNIINTNVANVTFNNCVSVNCRDAMAGNHGKNITINGGRYFCIDDHYGLNYIIRDADVHGISTWVPGYCTPAADVSKWEFVPRAAFIFAGGNIRIENCRIYGASGIFGARPDIGDLYGSIALENLTVEAPGNVALFSLATFDAKTFDYAHAVRTPAQVTIRDVVMNGPGALTFHCRNRAADQSFPCRLSGIDRLKLVEAEKVRLNFSDCFFDQTEFYTGPKVRYSFADCEAAGPLKGLPQPLPAGLQDGTR